MIYAPNADYNLYALDLKGQLQWTFEADQSIWAHRFRWYQYLFWYAGTQSLCVNAKTGKQVWMQVLDGAVWVPGARENQRSLPGHLCGTLYALNTADGKTIWSKPASTWIWSGRFRTAPICMWAMQWQARRLHGLRWQQALGTGLEWRHRWLSMHVWW